MSRAEKQATQLQLSSGILPPGGGVKSDRRTFISVCSAALTEHIFVVAVPHSKTF